MIVIAPAQEFRWSNSLRILARNLKKAEIGTRGNVIHADTSLATFLSHK